MSTKSYNKVTYSSSNRIIQNLMTTAICFGIVVIGSEALADVATKGGIEVAKNISSTISKFFIEDARAMINGAILAGGGIGAAMARNWLPIGGAALGIGFYEVIRLAI